MLKCYIKLENEHGVQSEWTLYSVMVRETVTNRTLGGGFNVIVTVDGYTERRDWLPITKIDKKQTKANKRKAKR